MALTIAFPRLHITDWPAPVGVDDRPRRCRQRDATRAMFTADDDVGASGEE